jgi:hypothetical protein
LAAITSEEEMIVAMMIAAALQATAPQAADPEVPIPNWITKPEWISKPSGRDISNAYPTKALNSFLAGTANLKCEVNGDGKLEDCNAEPADAEADVFVKPALSLAHLFQMKIEESDEKFVAGRPVRIPITFVAFVEKLKDVALTDPSLVDGRAWVNCRITPPSKIDNCFVLDEQPVGSGARSLALKLAPKIRITAPRQERFDVWMVFKKGS